MRYRYQRALNQSGPGKHAWDRFHLSVSIVYWSRKIGWDLNTVNNENKVWSRSSKKGRPTETHRAYAIPRPNKKARIYVLSVECFYGPADLAARWAKIIMRSRFVQGGKAILAISSQTFPYYLTPVLLVKCGTITEKHAPTFSSWVSLLQVCASCRADQ